MNKPKMGRPTIENPSTAKLPNIRLKPEQLQAYVEASDSRDETLSAWVRRNLDRIAKRELNQ